MDLQEIWNLPEKEPFIPTPETIKQTIHSKSKSIMETLRNGLRTKLYFVLAFSLLYLAVALYNTHPLLTILFSIITVIHLLLMLFGFRQYKNLQPGLPSEHTALSQMQQVYASIKKALWVEKYVFMSLQPVLLIAGCLLGGTISGKEVPELIQDTHFLLTILICQAVFSPLAYWLTEKMNYQAFGQYLEKLEHNIRMLERSE